MAPWQKLEGEGSPMTGLTTTWEKPLYYGDNLEGSGSTATTSASISSIRIFSFSELSLSESTNAC